MLHLHTSSSNSSTTLNTGNLAPSMVLGLCCLVGVPGNIAVVVMIVRNFKTENFTLKLMLSLAVSDLLSLITMPMWIYDLLHGWKFGRTLCKFIPYLVYGSLFSSVFTVTLMSVHRYLSVLYPQYWAKLHGMGERVLLFTLWGLPGVLATPDTVFRDVRMKEDGYNHCKRFYNSSAWKVAVLLIETVLGFVVPFSIMATSYFCLHKKVNQTAFFNNHRMTKLVTSIVVTFFIFWIPLSVTNIIGLSGVWLESKTVDHLFDVMWEITGALTFINSCVNPFLYAFTARNLRQDNQQ